MVTFDPNPYQSPNSAAQPQATEQSQSRGVGTSVFFILVGLFFCLLSFYLLFGHGLDKLLSAYRSLGRFYVLFMVFYGFTGGLTAVFHLSYLFRGWPKQSLAGIYAIFIALGLVAVAAAILEFIA